MIIISNTNGLLKHDGYKTTKKHKGVSTLAFAKNRSFYK